jgi:hypothetical protein
VTAVVVLNYGRPDLTAACCESLLAQDSPPARILVVDNGSPSHGEAELRAALPPGVDLLPLPSNLGFSGGMNAGMREVLRDPAVDSVLFLNNDTRCPPDLLRAMRHALASDPAVGIVGCDMVGSDGGSDQPAGAKLHPLFAYSVPCCPGESPDYLLGACLLLPRDVLEATGGFDERYPFFFEDADLSLRVRRLGRTLAIAPGVRILHRGSATIAALTARQAEWYRRSHRLFLHTWYSLPTARALPPFLFRLAADLLHGRLAAVAGSWRGWRAPLPPSSPKNLRNPDRKDPT